MTLDIARQFSRVPAGRDVEDGPFCGEIFRETLLLPALERGSQVSVLMDGTEGYGSSFLEEAFGGLVRRGLAAADLRQRLHLRSEEDPTLIEEVFGYIDDQEMRQRAARG